MKIEVKLYSYHDMDLVSLYKTGRVSFPETTRQILNSYANKEAYKVRLLEAVSYTHLDVYKRQIHMKPLDKIKPIHISFTLRKKIKTII